MNFEVIPPIRDIEIFATNEEIRELRRLKKCYGGVHWHKCKGFARVKVNDYITSAELHWYQCHSVGVVEMKIKDFL